jgi:O-antigen/teichoic acid export membrane protein
MARHFLVNVGSLTGSRLVIVLSQILVLPIVARHLDISDFGDVALAMIVVVFGQLLSDMGLGRSLIRKEKFDAAEWSSAFWFLTLIGLLLTGALIVIAPIWSWVFDRQVLAPLIMALSVIPFLFSLSAVSTALLERDGRFPTLAGLRIAAAVVGFITTIALAMNGAGAWALISQQIAIALVQCGGSIMLSRFRPLSPLTRAPLGDHLSFARNTLGVSFLMTAQRQVPMMMIGYVLGATSLGLYSMSERIQNLPVNGVAAPFSRVVFINMSAAQKEPVKICQIYMGGLLLMAMAVIPPFAMLASVGETAFPLLLSEPWRPVATIFALVAPGIALDASTSHAGVLFQAVNRTGLRLKMVFERTLLRLAMIGAAMPFGIEAVAGAITISALCYQPRLWVHLGRAVPFDGSAVPRTLLGPVVLGVMLWGAGQWLQTVTTGFTTLGLAIVFLIVAWGVAALIMRRRLRWALSTLRT